MRTLFNTPVAKRLKQAAVVCVSSQPPEGNQRSIQMRSQFGTIDDYATTGLGLTSTDLARLRALFS